MSLIEEGKKAPAFTLNDQHGKAHRLSDYAGRPVILYFYPKDDTPGCTKESCEFRDNLPQFEKSKAVVFGVSILDEASKKRFADKFDLTFSLLADEDHAVAEKYGVWQKSRSTAAPSWASSARRISSVETARSRSDGTTSKSTVTRKKC
jgi:peroxiredoxin Q/BCP